MESNKLIKETFTKGLWERYQETEPNQKEIEADIYKVIRFFFSNNTLTTYYLTYKEYFEWRLFLDAENK